MRKQERILARDSTYLSSEYLIDDYGDAWADYGIDKKRCRELQEIAKSDEYAKIVLDCALRADRKSAGHIVLSVAEGLSYEHVEFHERLGRCPLGRSDFYGARRLFFHYLDCALRGEETKIQEDGVNE